MGPCKCTDDTTALEVVQYAHVTTITIHDILCHVKLLLFGADFRLTEGGDGDQYKCYISDAEKTVAG